MITDLRNRIFKIKGESDFQDAALKIFHYQCNNNPVYRSFISFLGRDPLLVKSVLDIPFLPVEFFRSHKIITENLSVEKVFESSGTSGSIPGRHFIHDIKLYEESFLRSFKQFYGDPESYFIGALLPSYHERENSSLIYMMNELIGKSSDTKSGFFKDDEDKLIRLTGNALRNNQKVLLLGVSFALLDLAENHISDISGAIVMETGGMKGKRKEMTREELHLILEERLNVSVVHSEYGMTELLSQAYSKGNGLFDSPSWMKILIRDPQDPLSLISEPGVTGGINIIDLANIYSCSFIATGDLGKLHYDGRFEVLGRFDRSDVRGCNLLIEK
jgi:phenylacetate-coenzyme A ligase PaaK-like adenylate-forming protein